MMAMAKQNKGVRVLGLELLAIRSSIELVECPFTERSFPLFCLAANKQVAPNRGRALCFYPPSHPARSTSKEESPMPSFTAKDFITPEFMARWRKQAELEEKFHKALKTKEKWNVLREIYEELTPRIIANGKKGKLGFIDPYYVDWTRLFTPIEYDAWCSIRPKCIALYPQYPVLNYFIDFAHPYLKVGVEMDGKKWHDADKDRARDEKLAEIGWRIFRIPGAECYAKIRMLEEIVNDEYLTDDYERRTEIEDYFLKTSDGVFKAIEILYFRRHFERYRKYFDIAVKTLNQHRLAGFSIL